MILNCISDDHIAASSRSHSIDYDAVELSLSKITSTPVDSKGKEISVDFDVPETDSENVNTIFSSSSSENTLEMLKLQLQSENTQLDGVADTEESSTIIVDIEKTHMKLENGK